MRRSFLVFVTAAVFLMVGGTAVVGRAQTSSHQIYLPLVSNSGTAIALPVPPTDKNDTPAYVNYYRTVAGLAPVTFDNTLNSNCYKHAVYMAEEEDITHDESTSSPWYTAEGQQCAQKGNAWLGWASSGGVWQPYHAIEGWLDSVGHRLWMLHPGTTTFGFGFYETSHGANQYTAGAALDVLTYFDWNADANYPNWPVLYPARNQQDVPSTKYVITLSWGLAGETPVVSAVSLQTAGGTPLPHSYQASLPIGQGIQITPSSDLPANTTIEVSVSGTYNGTPFQYDWSFKTGN